MSNETSADAPTLRPKRSHRVTTPRPTLVRDLGPWSLLLVAVGVVMLVFASGVAVGRGTAPRSLVTGPVARELTPGTVLVVCEGRRAIPQDVSASTMLVVCR